MIRRDPGSTTLYLSTEEITRDNVTGTLTGTRYYSHNGTVVALRVGGANISYLQADQHGTTQVSVKAETIDNHAVTRAASTPTATPLAVVADDSVFDEIESLVRNQAYGKSRQMLVLGLGNSKDPRAIELLVDLLRDEDVTAHALMALGKLKEPRVRPEIESMLAHRQALVRREAKKALAKLPVE